MKRSTLLSLIFALSFLGLIDAWYLAQAALTHTALTCDIAGLNGCNVVAQSRYSHLLGVPLGAYGVAFYAVMLALAVLFAVQKRLWVARTMYLLALAGAAASIGFLYVQFALIDALCVYCLASAAISFLLLLPAQALTRPESDPAATP